MAIVQTIEPNSTITAQHHKSTCIESGTKMLTGVVRCRTTSTSQTLKAIHCEDKGLIFNDMQTPTIRQGFKNEYI